MVANLCPNAAEPAHGAHAASSNSRLPETLGGKQFPVGGAAGEDRVGRGGGDALGRVGKGEPPDRAEAEPVCLPLEAIARKPAEQLGRSGSTLPPACRAR
jgi:hypothetical protein